MRGLRYQPLANVLPCDSVEVFAGRCCQTRGAARLFTLGQKMPESVSLRLPRSQEGVHVVHVDSAMLTQP